MIPDLNTSYWDNNVEIGHRQLRQRFSNLLKILAWDKCVGTGCSQLRLKARDLRSHFGNNYVKTGHGQLRHRVDDLIKFPPWDKYIENGHIQVGLSAGELFIMILWDKALHFCSLTNFKYKRKLINVIL